MSTLNTLLLVLPLVVSTALPAAAQTAADRPAPSLRSLAATAQLPANEPPRSTTRRNDSLWNGALIGAASGVAGSLLLCRTMEPWEVCRDDVGAMATSAAIGAAIGIGVDALIRASATSPADRARRPGARRWTRYLPTPGRR
jgi:hypothetical protein